MLTPEQVEHYQTHGFVLGDQILDDAGVDRLCAELDRVIAQEHEDVPQPVALARHDLPDENVLWQTVNMWEASDAYCELVHDALIVEEIVQLMDAGVVRLWHDQIAYRPHAAGGEIPWH